MRQRTRQQVTELVSSWLLGALSNRLALLTQTGSEHAKSIELFVSPSRTVAAFGMLHMSLPSHHGLELVR